MSQPVILCVDDEPEVLAAVRRDLRRHYKGEYRIIAAGSGAEAMDAARTLKERDEAVALLLSDQRMPGMEGTDFLDQARRLHPHARKVLLTAYADTSAAIASINEVDLDYYLLKPWDPPEENLYPVLDDLLSDWAATAPVPYDGIRVAGALWSAASHDIKDFLARNRVPYRWVDVEEDADAMTQCEIVCRSDGLRFPVVFFPDGTTLVQPDRRALADKVGLHADARERYYDLVVVGGGPAGLAAAVYGASEGLSTLLVEKEATGGQAGTSSRIENYLGFPSGVSGADLARRAATQAERLGAELLVPQEVDSITLEGPYKTVRLSGGEEITCRAVLLATGVSVRRLEAPGVDAVNGAGVYYGAALTEAAHYRGQHVFVLGGGNSAGQGAMFFSRYASQVTILIRRESLEETMSSYLIDQLEATENVDLWPHRQVAAVEGTDRLEALVLEDVRSGDKQRVEAAALFVFIGAQPRSELVRGLVECTEDGFVLTGSDLVRQGLAAGARPPAREPALLETSVPGIFAAGDVRQGSSKRVAAAVGEGSVAVQLIHRYLATV